MYAFLMILMIIISILLMLVVLIQPGKGDMITGMGGISNTFTSMLGSRRAMDMLTKITIGLAAALMVIALGINLIITPGGSEAAKPLIEGVAVPQTTPNQPVKPLAPQGQQPAQPQQDAQPQQEAQPQGQQPQGQ